MKYHNKIITLLEVPGETALVYTITGCPLKCEGCHSKHMWKKGSGEDLDMQTLTADLYLYNRMITAVCFMGGEWEEPDLIEALTVCKSFNLKTCLYTGLPTVSDKLLPLLDYYKVGAYQEALGGLDSKSTNQRFIAIVDGNAIDQTHKFQKGSLTNLKSKRRSSSSTTTHKR